MNDVIKFYDWMEELPFEDIQTWENVNKGILRSALISIIQKWKEEKTAEPWNQHKWTKEELDYAVDYIYEKIDIDKPFEEVIEHFIDKNINEAWGDFLTHTVVTDTGFFQDWDDWDN